MWSQGGSKDVLILPLTYEKVFEREQHVFPAAVISQLRGPSPPPLLYQEGDGFPCTQQHEVSKARRPRGVRRWGCTNTAQAAVLFHLLAWQTEAPCSNQPGKCRSKMEAWQLRALFYSWGSKPSWTDMRLVCFYTIPRERERGVSFSFTVEMLPVNFCKLPRP